MSISNALREQVKQRAGFACEYCGVTETDTGGMLTIDHFQPQAKGGSDATENLVYCYHRCNEYKSDYWPQDASQTQIWNPRRQSAKMHFMEAADGRLVALTESGRFTLSRLRLNRSPLVAHRLRHKHNQEEQRLLTRLRDITAILEQMQQQYNDLLEENHSLLHEQRQLVQLLQSAKK